MNDRLKLSHHYPGAYHLPNDLWTPEEIEEAGFIFVEYPTFIHQFDDPTHPIMKSYIDGTVPNVLPMICKTARYCGVGYTKTYDLDAGRWRGIESVFDYFSKKDIFKPMILKWMKDQKYHYVHRISLEDSPFIWKGTFGSSEMYYHRYAVHVRGTKLPINHNYEKC